MGDDIREVTPGLTIFDACRHVYIGEEERAMIVRRELRFWVKISSNRLVLDLFSAVAHTLSSSLTPFSFFNHSIQRLDVKHNQPPALDYPFLI